VTALNDASKVINQTAKIFCFVAALTVSMTQPVNIHRKPRHVNGNGVLLHFFKDEKTVIKSGRVKYE
jgi:hypothetical protein